MSDRYFLDTNVFVYSLEGGASAKARRASHLVREAITTRNGIVSYQVVQEFFNVAFRRFTPAMTSMEAEQYLATVFRPLLAVHSSHALCAEALRVRNRYRLSWYDSLIIAAALEAGCRVLYTADLRDGQKFGDLGIENPFQ